MDQDKNSIEQKILKAALKVVNQKTIAGTRMHLIAAMAAIGQSNVHYYFKTKEELMLALQEKILQKCYEIRARSYNKGEATLESHLHAFFQQKKYLISKKKEYDFAEMNFLVQGKIDLQIKDRFVDSYEQWREDIREVIVKFCPELPQSDKDMIPYMVVSMLQGASVQMLADENDFEIDSYFADSEKMILNYINSLRT